MKKFLLGVLVTLLIEVCWFGYHTVSTTVKVETNYNPAYVVRMLEK